MRTAIQMTKILAQGAALLCFLTACGETRSPGDAAHGDAPKTLLRLVGRDAPDSYFLFLLSNNSDHTIKFSGAVRDDGVIFPLPYLTHVECRNESEPAKWIRGRTRIGSWEKSDAISVESGREVKISVDTSEASGKRPGNCRITLATNDGAQIISDVF